MSALFSPTTIFGASIREDKGLTNVASNPAIQGGTPDSTVPSPVSGILDLTGVNRPLIQVTGANDISSIIGLTDGQSVILRFSGVLNLINGTLDLPGHENIRTDPGGWAEFYRAGSAVNFVNYTTVDGASIANCVTVYTGILKPRGSSQSLWMDLSAGSDKLAWVKGDHSGLIVFDMGALDTLQVWDMPNQSGAIVLDSAIQTLTNKSISADQITSGFLLEARMPGLNGDVLSDPGSIVTVIADGVVTFSKMATAAWSDDVTMAADSSTLFPTQHAARTYADNLKAGLKFKVDCRVASTANVNIASAPSSIDSITLTSGDRAFLKNQTAGAENGPYIFNGAGNAMTRTTDGDTGTELVSATFPIREGTLNQDKWFTITNDTITLGTTAIVVTQTGGAGTYTNGAGLSLTGNSFSITTGGVTLAMLADLAADTIVGRANGAGTGVPQALTATQVRTILGGTGGTSGTGALVFGTLDATATASTIVTRDASGNIAANNLNGALTTTVSSGATITMTVASAMHQYVTGSASTTFKLPVTSTLILGTRYVFINAGTSTVNVRSSGNNTIGIVAAGGNAILTCIDLTGTGVASWSMAYNATFFALGKKLTINRIMTLDAFADNNTYTLPISTCALAAINLAQDWGDAQSFSLLKIASGSNAKAGTFTLVAGTVTVGNTSVTANSVIIPTLKTVGGTPTVLPYCTPTAGTGFVAVGGVADTSTYNYVILEVN